MAIFAPLPAHHPAIGRPCARCGEPFKLGDRTILTPRAGGERDGFTVEADLVHATPCSPPAARTIEPKPGFDWTRVRWTGPHALVDDTCSYCGAAISEDSVPLRLWNERSWAAVFCDACMKTWWGMELCDSGEADDDPSGVADDEDWDDEDEDLDDDDDFDDDDPGDGV